MTDNDISISFGTIIAALAFVLVLVFVVNLDGKLEGYQEGIRACCAQQAPPAIDTLKYTPRPAVDKYKKYQEYEDSRLETR
jgi:hypothetical protein